MSEMELTLKNRITILYQQMIREDNMELQLLNLLQECVMQPLLPSNILKAALRTIKKLIENITFRQQLKTQGFKAANLLKALYACQFDSHDNDQEEVILLLIQKIVIKIVDFFFNELETVQDKLGCCKYFLKVLKKRALNDSSLSSMHMNEGSKRNMNLLFSLIMQKDESERQIKTTILQMLTSKVNKHLQKICKPQTTTELNLSKEYLISLVKAIHESVQSVFLIDEEARWLINQNKNLLIQFTCSAAENNQVIIRNLTQQFFSMLLKKILDLKLAMREEVEVIFVKVALKPLYDFQEKCKPVKIDKPIEVKQTDQSEISIFSDNEEGEQKQPLQIDYSIQADGHSMESMELDMNLSFLLELILSLSPEQIAQFYLVYDLQPFSENIIAASMTLLIKMSQLQGQNGNINQCFNVISMILKTMNTFQMTMSSETSQKGISQLVEMMENKAQVLQIVKAANDKPKKFYQTIEENFDMIDETIAPKVASKVLMYSRRVLIDKIAEIFGGKDENSKRCLEQYLQRQDYSLNHVQDSLRSFMQTFRMAGIDSQVVFRILEHFSNVYYSHDEIKTFVSQEEAYEFTYLIIVLQTCQHNPSIKEKTSLERFMGQALAIVPQSFATLPKGFVEDVFNKVTSNEIKAPITRNILKGNFEKQIFDEIKLRLINSSKQQTLSESEFVSTSDLTQRQLYEFNNCIDGVAPVSLQQASLRHLVSLITAKFCQLNAKQGDSRFSQFKKFDLTKQLIQVNQTFKNADWIDRLLIDLDKQVNALYKIKTLDNERKIQAIGDLQNLFWSNFSSLKLAVVLLPKLAPNLLKAHEGLFHYASFNAVEYRIRTKFNQKAINEKCLLTQQQDPQQMQLQASKEGTQTGGLFSIVYNYFAETNPPQDEQKKRQDHISSGQQDCESLKQILDTFNLVRLVNVVKNTQHVKQAEEQPCVIKFISFLEDKGITFEMTVDLLVTFAKENLHARKTLLCLEFIKQMYDACEYKEHLDVQYQQKFVKLRLHVFNQFKTLIQIVVRPQLKEPKTPQLVQSNSKADDKQETRSETDSFERISTKSDQFSFVETPVQNLAVYFLKPPVFSQLDQSLCEQLNKHLIFDIYMHSAKDILKFEVNQTLRDVQKTIQAIVEEDLIKEQFEEAFLLQRITLLLQETSIILDGVKWGNKIDFLQQKLADIVHIEEKPSSLNHTISYSKLPKLLRLITILMIQSNSEACNKDHILCSLLQLLRLVTTFFAKIRPTPFDQMASCLDTVLMKPQTKTIGLMLDSEHLLAEPLLQTIMDICENIFQALEENKKFNNKDSASFEVWFKVLKVIQNKVLLSPYCSLFVNVQERACGMLKTQILNFQFQASTQNVSSNILIRQNSLTHLCQIGTGISMSGNMGASPQTKSQMLNSQHKEIKSQAKRIFQDILFQGLSYENLQVQFKLLRSLDYFKGSFVQTQILNQWDDEMEGFAQLCQLTVNTMTDVFIYYSTSLQDISLFVDENDSEIRLAENFEMFSLLWLHFMRVLLYFAEEATSLAQIGNYAQSSLPMQQSVHDSIQRTMDFLISQRILIAQLDDDLTSSFISDSSCKDSLEAEKHKLYKTTCEVIGQYWQQPTDKFQRPQQMIKHEPNTENTTQYQI